MCVAIVRLQSVMFYYYDMLQCCNIQPISSAQYYADKKTCASFCTKLPCMHDYYNCVTKVFMKIFIQTCMVISIVSTNQQTMT